MKRPLGPRLPHLSFPKDIVPRVLVRLRDPRMRLRFEAGLAIGLGVGLFLSLALYFGMLGNLDHLLTDLIYQPIQPSGKVAIIAIDQKSLSQIGTWPWPRTVHAAMLDRLSDAPPRVVVIDIPFTVPMPEDAGLAETIQKAGNVILAIDRVDAAAYPQKLGAFPKYDVLLLPPLVLRSAAKGLGHRMLAPDTDGVLRRAPIAIETTLVREPALGIAAADAYLGVGDIAYDLAHRRVSIGDSRIQTDDYGQMLLNFGGARKGIDTYSYSDVYAGLIPTTAFTGKIVFIGGTSTTEQETFATPLSSGTSSTYNVAVEAGIAEMLVTSPPQLLLRDDPLNQIAVILFVALIAGLTLPHLRPLSAAALTILFLIFLMLASSEAFDLGFIIHVIYPALALLLTFVVIATFRYLSEERRRQFLTTLFRRYVSAESVAHVVDAVDRGELPLTGTRRKVTVLYADLRGFSSLSDGLAPEAVLDFVNSYLELMLREIQLESGTVNKPMGDALVAIWNAPLDQPDHASRALRSAVGIRRSILRFQKARGEEKSVNIGLGLATGFAVLGNINALGKVEYTLVGETVNVASRISAFAGSNQILADAETAEATPIEIEKRELTPVRVRGRKDPLPIWEIKDSTDSVTVGEEEEEWKT